MRGRNSGFVAYRLREDAEAGMEALQEATLEGHVLRIGWAKAVANPERHTIIRRKTADPGDGDDAGQQQAVAKPHSAATHTREGEATSAGRAVAAATSSRRRGKRSNWDVAAPATAAAGFAGAGSDAAPKSELHGDPNAKAADGDAKIVVEVRARLSLPLVVGLESVL